MEIQNILTLIQAFTEHSLTELHVEDGGVKVCLKREPGAASGAGELGTVAISENPAVIPAAPVAVAANPMVVNPVTAAPVATNPVTAAVPVAAAPLTAVPTATIPVAAVPAAQASVMPTAVSTVASTAAVPTQTAAVPNMAAAAPADISTDKVVVSPLVGIFYSASSPEAENFVKVGDVVKKGQVLGIIEAMKLMNEIESEYDGVVEAILVNNEDVVEYGQPLFRIR